MAQDPFAEGRRVDSLCSWCRSPVTITYHGAAANHTVEPRPVNHPEIDVYVEDGHVQIDVEAESASLSEQQCLGLICQLSAALGATSQRGEPLA